jgi:hypothetical protein
MCVFFYELREGYGGGGEQRRRKSLNFNSSSSKKFWGLNFNPKPKRE